MLNFIKQNWLDIIIALVGLSAVVIYLWQKYDSRKIAATLILGQIDSIEKNVYGLKSNHQLNHVIVFNTPSIIRENLWEQNKHLLVKEFSNSEYELVQNFFSCSEQIERTRKEIIQTITTAWSDKSNVEHQIIAKYTSDILEQNIDAPNFQMLFRKVELFQQNFRPIDIVFTPDIILQNLISNLNGFDRLSGTTAYQKIQRISHKK